MKDFFSDLFYYCSSSNTSSRGFYIFITIMLFAIPVGILASIIMMIVSGFSALKLGLIIAGIVLEAIVIVWLNRG